MNNQLTLWLGVGDFFFSDLRFLIKESIIEHTVTKPPIKAHKFVMNSKGDILV